MNKEQVKEAIKVMEHWLNGGEVEFKSRRNDNWLLPPCGRPSWNWYDSEYRIKKEPLEVCLISYGNVQEIYHSYDDAVKVAKGLASQEVDYKFIKLREVIDESK